MKGDILRILREADGYVSGQELCDRFGVSRTAVWKAVNQLKEEGYEIEAVRNRGYALRGERDVLSETEIGSRLHTEWAGANVVFFDETDSTNIQARRQAELGAPHGTLVVAEKQDGGKGRRGRGWESPAGVGIWMSLMLRPRIRSVSASMLTLVMALAAARGIREATGLEPMIKWPNDLTLNKKKICGILTEMSTELTEIQNVVIGIGINVAQTGFPPEISATATSLYLESGTVFNRSAIIARIMEAMEEYYGIFVRTEDMSALKDEYDRLLVNRDAEVCVLASSGEFRGIAEGIDGNGALTVRLPDGSRTSVISGEVSVRGIYGYV